MRRRGWANERRPRARRASPRAVRAALWAFALAAGAAVGALRGEALLARAFPERAAQVRLSLLGSEHAAAPELAAAAGVGPGVALASLDLAAVRGGVASHPWVRSARVAALPPDLLIVAVEERVPVAVASLGTEAWLVDTSGRAFVPAPADATLPLLRGAASPDDALLAEGVAWLDALERAGLDAPAELQLRGTDADAERAPALRLSAAAPAPGALVLLGSGEREGKLGRLAELLAARLPELATTAEIDLRFGAQVILRPRPEAEVANSSEVSKGG